MEIMSPVEGEVKPIESVNDEVFSEKIMGDGIAITPESQLIVSPVNGTVTAVFPTGHAVCVLTDEGVEILLHLGIDTVELEGKYYKQVVQRGQKVKQGELLVEMDYRQVKDAGYDNEVMVIITNSQEHEICKPLQTGKAVTTDSILVLK